MKNAQRLSQRQTAARRQAQYVEETTEEVPTGQVTEDGPVMITRRVKDRPKFIKWLRNKFGMTVFERQGGKLDIRDVKVGAPYTRVQHRPPARGGR